MKIERRTTMRDGTVAEDPRLGRLRQFDEKSRQYGVRKLLDPSATLKSKTWYMPKGYVLDQGPTSACTGFSATYDLTGSPNPLKDQNGLPFNNDFAQGVYKMAQKNDQWAGEDYEGSSVLGAAKGLQAMGFVGSYHWAFGIDEALLALSNLGPVVVGTDWYNSMFDPTTPTGLLSVDSSSGVAGGHAYQFRRITLSKDAKRTRLGRGVPLRDVPLISGDNSWGSGWGWNGRFAMWADDLEQLLKADGEARITTSPFHR